MYYIYPDTGILTVCTGTSENTDILKMLPPFLYSVILLVHWKFFTPVAFTHDCRFFVYRRAGVLPFENVRRPKGSGTRRYLAPARGAADTAAAAPWGSRAQVTKFQGPENVITDTGTRGSGSSTYVYMNDDSLAHRAEKVTAGFRF